MNIWPKGGLFWLLGYVFGYVALLVVALALSSALYLVAEYAEEFPTFAGKVVKYCLAVVLVLHLVLWFDGMPWFESLVGIGCNVCYATMFSSFPFVEILSARSIASALAFLLAHYVWFSYFLENGADIMHVVGFFVVMVWLVPGGLFVSLSINDNVLPGVTGSAKAAAAGEKGKGANLFKSIFDLVQDKVGPWFVRTFNSLAAKGTRITGGGAYGRSKKGEDYVSSYDSGGGYGAGGSVYGGSSISAPSQGGGYSSQQYSQQAPQYQQQQAPQYQQQQHQQYQQAPQYQQQQQYQQHPQPQSQPGQPHGYTEQPISYTSSLHANASTAGLKRR